MTQTNFETDIRAIGQIDSIPMILRMVKRVTGLGFAAAGSLGDPEVVGNVFSLASALLGMRRLVWAWPIGLVGNVLLFVVSSTGELSSHGDGEALWGQAGRQVADPARHEVEDAVTRLE